MTLVFSSGRWLVRLIQARPGHAVLLLAAAHLVLWTLFPALFLAAAPLDVVEGYLWGHEWQWGYHKHPPLAPWLLEGFLRITDGVKAGGPWTAYLLSQISVAIGFWAVWSLARPMVGGPAAAIAVLALELNFYTTFPALEFNPNVLQIPLWSLAILHFHRALITARWRFFMLLGVWMGLLIYTKYSALILALAFAVVVLTTDRGRAALKSPKLYLGAVLALLIAAPHFAWIVTSDYLPFTYALTQKTAQSLATRFYFPANFLAAQIACHAVLLLVAGFLWVGNRRGAERCPEIIVQQATDFDQRYVFILAIAPLTISVVLCFAMGIEFLTMWGMPMFALSGLALVLVARRSFKLWLGSRLATAYLCLVVGLPIAISVGLAVTPSLTDRANRTMWPAEQHARLVTQHWRDATGAPLRVVAGDIWAAGLVGLYSPDRPSVLIEGDFRRSPWIDQDTLRKTGFAIVWRARWGAKEPPGWVIEKFPDRKDLGLFNLPSYALPLVGPAPDPYAVIGISIVMPHPRQSASGGGSAGIASTTAQ